MHYLKLFLIGAAVLLYFLGSDDARREMAVPLFLMLLASLQPSKTSKSQK